MKKSEFDLIARLLKSKEPVIFDGVANADAARQLGVTPQAVHRSTKRFQALHNEICVAFKRTLA